MTGVIGVSFRVMIRAMNPRERERERGRKGERERPVVEFMSIFVEREGKKNVTLARTKILLLSTVPMYQKYQEQEERETTMTSFSKGKNDFDACFKHRELYEKTESTKEI